MRSIRTELVVWLAALGVVPALAATVVTAAAVWHAERRDDGEVVERAVSSAVRALEYNAERTSQAATRAVQERAWLADPRLDRVEDGQAVCRTMAAKYGVDAVGFYDEKGQLVTQHGGLPKSWPLGGEPRPAPGQPSLQWLPAPEDGMWFGAAARVPVGTPADKADVGLLVLCNHIGRKFCTDVHRVSGTLIAIYGRKDTSPLAQSGGMAIDAESASLVSRATTPTRLTLGDYRWLVISRHVRLAGRTSAVRVSGAVRAQDHWQGMVQAGWLIMAMLSGVILLSSGAGAALARKIADPLVEIAGAARSLASGDLSRRVRVDGANELGSLSESFNHMAGELEEQTQQLRGSNEELDRQMARVQELNSLLREAVRTDSLTQVRTHGYIQQQLAKHLEVAKQSRRPLSVLMIDVDHFKWINDTHGHPTGDQALKEVARSISSAVRHNDLVGRQGGDEFCVVLPAAGAADAERCADRIKSAIARASVRGANRTPLRLTVSVGSATFPDDGEEATSLVAAADRALYQAKLWRHDASALVRVDGAYFGTVPDDSPLLDGPTVQVALAMAASVGSSESGTVHHAYAVAVRAAAIGAELRLGRDGRTALRIACLLHDIGKVGLPRELLQKDAAHTPEERRLVESHAELGYRILRHLGLPQPVPEVVRCHHERYDGTGHPRGLQREQVPLGARIAAVAETFVRLTLPTECKEPLSSDEALRRIEQEAGKAFDPTVVAALAQTLTWKGPTAEGERFAGSSRQTVPTET